MPELAETLNSWQTSWRAIAAADTDNRVPLASGVPQSLSISIESEDDTKEWQNDCSTQGRTIRNASDVPSELRAVIGFRARLNQYLQDGAIWVKTLFDQHGRLRWWAFRLQRETAELELVASGRSGRGAARRIQLECAILDAQIEASYNLLSIDADDWREGWEKIDPGAVLRRALPEKLNTASATEWQRTLTAAREAVRRLREGIARGTGNMPDVSFPKLLCVAHLAETFCNAIDNARSSGIERELIGWQETVNTIDRGWTGLEGANPDEILQAFDRLLNNACDAHLEGISRELSLESLNRCLNQDTDLLVTLDGPLSSAPIEYLRIAGVPLHQRVQSITSVLSTSLAVVQPTAHRAPAGTDSDNAMFTAIWQSKDSRSADRYDGLYILHAGLHQLCKQQSPGAAGNWSCRSAVDSPPADNATIQSTLAADIFPIIVIGGHGLLGSRQRHGPSRKSGIEVAPAIRSKAKKDLWHGNGDLRGNQAMILCACMVGRLCDDEDDGIRGLFTEALVAGGRVFIGARWTVHACYSALFCLRLTERLMQSLREHGTIKENRPFLVSRIINQVRREMLQEMPRAMHSISAFTCFGLSEHRN